MTAEMGRYQQLKLYGYAESSSSWRVRIALAAKKIEFENIPMNLMAGEHRTESFLAKNPHGQVPLLEYTDTQTGEVAYISQSAAIIEFLDLAFPDVEVMFPKDPIDRVAAREIVEIVNAGIQPLQNRAMVATLEKLSEGKIVGKDFGKAVIVRGLTTLETLVRKRQGAFDGPYCLGSDKPTAADLYLIPQLYNSVRVYGVDVAEDFPVLAKIESLCASHPWFIPAHPLKQPDAPKE